MISIRATVTILFVILGLSCAAPAPGYHHKHVKIIVPEYHHTVHHHHVEKVHVPVHVVKKVYVPVETHHDIHHDVHHDFHHDIHHGGWW